MASYYESDITRLMRGLLERNPEIVAEQKRGRSLWWDKPSDPETQRRAAESRVRQAPYVYQSRS